MALTFPQLTPAAPSIDDFAGVHDRESLLRCLLEYRPDVARFCEADVAGLRERFVRDVELAARVETSRPWADVRDVAAEDGVGVADPAPARSGQVRDVTVAIDPERLRRLVDPITLEDLVAAAHRWDAGLEAGQDRIAQLFAEEQQSVHALAADPATAGGVRRTEIRGLSWEQRGAIARWDAKQRARGSDQPAA